MTVDTYKLLKQVDDAIKATCVGYGIAIYKDGVLTNSTGGGWAVMPDSQYPAGRKYDSTVRQSMGSMGKTVSAAAVVKALLFNGISLDAPIHDEIEDMGWTFGMNARKVTYRMVLTHTTGMGGFDPSMKNLKTKFAAGFSSLPATCAYFNGNYDLTRFLVPILYGEKLGAAATDTDYGKKHIEIVKREVLKPCGLDVDVVYTGAQPATRYYAKLGTPGTFATGNTLAQAEDRVGAGWWITSAREYAHLIDKLRGGALGSTLWSTLSQSAAGTAPMARLGMWADNVEGGEAYGHNGGVPGQLYSQWMAFPEGVTAVVSTNTDGGTVGKDFAKVLRDAWTVAHS